MDDRKVTISRRSQCRENVDMTSISGLSHHLAALFARPPVCLGSRFRPPTAQWRCDSLSQTSRRRAGSRPAAPAETRAASLPTHARTRVSASSATDSSTCARSALVLFLSTAQVSVLQLPYVPCEPPPSRLLLPISPSAFPARLGFPVVPRTASRRDPPPPDHPHAHRSPPAAADLGVERRRMYDVVNVLESIGMLVRHGVNVYEWLGQASLDEALKVSSPHRGASSGPSRGTHMVRPGQCPPRWHASPPGGSDLPDYASPRLRALRRPTWTALRRRSQSWTTQRET